MVYIDRVEDLADKDKNKNILGAKEVKYYSAIRFVDEREALIKTYISSENDPFVKITLTLN